MQKLKSTCLPNVFRNERFLALMNTLEKQMGRAVAHKPEMLEEEQLEQLLSSVRGAVSVGESASCR